MKDTSLIDKINWPLLPLTATAMKIWMLACNIRIFRLQPEFGPESGAQYQCDTRNVNQTVDISNNSSFCRKDPGDPDSSERSGGTSYPLTENQTRPFAQATGRIAYFPFGGYHTMPHNLTMSCVVYYNRRSGIRLPLLCVRNVVMYTDRQNATYVTLFAGVAVMQ
jgi:hypothetical protein